MKLTVNGYTFDGIEILATICAAIVISVILVCLVIFAEFRLIVGFFIGGFGIISMVALTALFFSDILPKIRRNRTRS